MSRPEAKWTSTAGFATVFGQSSGAVLLENIAVVELTVLIEMVVDRSMGGGKLLQGFDVSEPGHRPLSSAERLV